MVQVDSLWVILLAAIFNINNYDNYLFSPVHTHQLDEDSDSDTRLHHPSSNSRTQFTAQTPAAEKAAIQSLKTKMTFSDHSVSSQEIGVCVWMYLLCTFKEGCIPQNKAPLFIVGSSACLCMLCPCQTWLATLKKPSRAPGQCLYVYKMYNHVFGTLY